MSYNFDDFSSTILSISNVKWLYLSGISWLGKFLLFNRVKLKPTGTNPSSRSGASSGLVWPNWYIFCGCSDNWNVNDVWTLNLLTLVWEKLNLSADSKNNISPRDKAATWVHHDRYDLLRENCVCLENLRIAYIHECYISSVELFSYIHECYISSYIYECSIISLFIILTLQFYLWMLNLQFNSFTTEEKIHSLM